MFFSVILFDVNMVNADVDNIFWGGYEANIQATLGLGNEDPRNIIANVVNVVLGFVGIVAVMIIVMSGFKFMTTGGNEDVVVEARKMLASGVIGLIIVISSFGVAQFVVNNLFVATSAVG